MNRRSLLLLATLPLAPAIAEEAPRQPDSPRVRAADSAVIEAVLLDLLHSEKSPAEEERGQERSVFLSADALTWPVKPAELLQQYRPELWARLSVSRIYAARQAAADLTRRVNGKDGLPSVAPRDHRIRILTRRDEESLREGKPQFRWPQVFRAYPPGYSRDGEVALVHVEFPWSGGFHFGNGTYILVRQEGKWEVMFGDFIYYF